VRGGIRVPRCCTHTHATRATTGSSSLRRSFILGGKHGTRPVLCFSHDGVVNAHDMLDLAAAGFRFPLSISSRDMRNVCSLSPCSSSSSSRTFLNRPSTQSETVDDG
jgi:hypothetical protein